MIDSTDIRMRLSQGGLVKICGLREPDHAAFAAAAGADLLGFIFAPARRRVTAEVARACIDAARESAGNRSIVAVGVFVDADSSAIAETARAAGLDAVQLSGSEPPEFVAALGIPAIKALRPQQGTSVATVLAEMSAYDVAGPCTASFLIDGYVEGASGGTGERADWDLAAALSARRPMVLAGGLDPENVAEAIERVRPRAVDVSSGVESGGIKDPDRIRAFLREAKAAFALHDEPRR